MKDNVDSELATLWRELAFADVAPTIVDAAHEALESDPSHRVCIGLLARFPTYLKTPGEAILREHLSRIGPDIDPGVLREIGLVFVKLWRRRPRSAYWYGDLCQSFVPHNLKQRLVGLSEVESQLLDDFRTLAPLERSAPTELGRRRLERAGELLLLSPSEQSRLALLPIVMLDYIDPQHAEPMPTRYEGVFWAMLRILRKLDERI